MTTVKTVGEDGQIKIPLAMLRGIGATSGSEVILHVEDGVILICSDNKPRDITLELLHCHPLG